jgi:hypothetical protein
MDGSSYGIVAKKDNRAAVMQNRLVGPLTLRYIEVWDAS